jgi:hypothetical protein
MTPTNRPHDARHIWAKMASGHIRCGYIGCQARPAQADVERLEGEIATAAKMRIRLQMTPRA